MFRWSEDSESSGVILSSSIPLPFLLILPCLILYLPSLSYFFAQDDFGFLLEASQTHFENIFGMLGPTKLFWRPLSTSIYFTVMFKLFGIHPLPYHLFSLAIFCGCVLLVYLLGKMLSDSVAEGFIIAFLFSTRGVHFETVSWISCIQDLLMIFFGLACVICYVAYSRGGKSLLLPAMGLFILACFSKETAFILPCILFSYELILNRDEDILTKCAPLTGFFLLALFLATVRQTSAPQMPETGEYAVGLGEHWYRLLLNYFLINMNAFFLPVLLFPKFRYFLGGFCPIFVLVLLMKNPLRAAGKTGFFAEMNENRVDVGRFLFGCVFFSLGVLPALFMKNRFEPYYTSLAAVGVSIALGNCIHSMNHKFKKIVLFFVCIASLMVNFQYRNKGLTHVGRGSRIAHNAISDLRNSLGPITSGTAIYIKRTDKRLLSALHFGQGIKLYFPGVERIEFDILEPEDGVEGNEVIYYYTNGHLKLDNSRPATQNTAPIFK